MILANHTYLKNALFQRWEELGWTPTFICADAAERGMKSITRDRISRYKTFTRTKDVVKCTALTEEQILFLAFRCGIEVMVNLGTPVVVDGVITYEIKPYNEIEAINKLKLIFPNL